MASQWKSTPSYWCKFCSVYVRDTAIERRNHEASGRHQGSIQRSLRDLHKSKAREERDARRAKDEVARLNAVVGTGSNPTMNSTRPVRRDTKDLNGNASHGTPQLSAAAQRKARAEQLLALGVPLPQELKREVTGVSEWTTVSERAIDDGGLNERKHADVGKSERGPEMVSKGVHKRAAEEGELGEDGAHPLKRKTWGSTFKQLPPEPRREDDLDALLSSVSTKALTVAATADDSTGPDKKVKVEDGLQTDIERKMDGPGDTEQLNTLVKEGDVEAQPVVFKKRKPRK